jgi:hypothetical protein
MLAGQTMKAETLFENIGAQYTNLGYFLSKSGK